MPVKYKIPTAEQYAVSGTSTPQQFADWMYQHRYTLDNYTTPGGQRVKPARRDDSAARRVKSRRWRLALAAGGVSFAGFASSLPALGYTAPLATVATRAGASVAVGAIGSMAAKGGVGGLAIGYQLGAAGYDLGSYVSASYRGSTLYQAWRTLESAAEIAAEVAAAPVTSGRALATHAQALHRAYNAFHESASNWFRRLYLYGRMAGFGY